MRVCLIMMVLLVGNIISLADEVKAPQIPESVTAIMKQVTAANTKDEVILVAEKVKSTLENRISDNLAHELLLQLTDKLDLKDNKQMELYQSIVNMLRDQNKADPYQMYRLLHDEVIALIGNNRAISQDNTGTIAYLKAIELQQAALQQLHNFQVDLIFQELRLDRELSDAYCVVHNGQDPQDRKKACEYLNKILDTDMLHTELSLPIIHTDRVSEFQQLYIDAAERIMPFLSLAEVRKRPLELFVTAGGDSDIEKYFPDKFKMLPKAPPDYYKRLVSFEYWLTLSDETEKDPIMKTHLEAVIEYVKHEEAK